MKRKLSLLLTLALLVSMVSGLGVVAYGGDSSSQDEYHYATPPDDDDYDFYRDFYYDLEHNAMTTPAAIEIAPMASFTRDIVSYQIVVESFDWGPGVTRLILSLDGPVFAEDINPSDFEVSVFRQAGFTFVRPGGTTVQDVPVINAFLSNAHGAPQSGSGQHITLEFEIHPDRGVNPFTFSIVPMANDWSVPFEPTVIWNGTPFTPSRGGKIMPITDNFNLSGSFTQGGVTLQYASFTPSQSGNRPLIIWLHGAGEGSANNTAGPEIALLGNRVTQLAAPEIQGIMGGAHVLVPTTPTAWMAGSAGWGGGSGYVSNYEEALLALIDDFVANTPRIDHHRIYIGGCSNGGYMVMRMLFERPNLYAAAWPICLWYEPELLTNEKINSIAHIPIWFIHDIGDPTTPHAHSLYLYGRLRAAGNTNAHMTTTDGIFSDHIFDTAGNPHSFNLHWSWIPALNNTITENIGGRTVSLFAWMAEQTTAQPLPPGDECEYDCGCDNGYRPGPTRPGVGSRPRTPAPAPRLADAPPRQVSATVNISGTSVYVTSTSTRANLAITSNQARAIINETAGDTVAFDLTQVSGFENIRDVRIPRAALRQFANAELAVEVALPLGTVTLSPEAVLSLTEQGAGNISVNLTVPSRGLLTASQRNTLRHTDTVVQVRILSGMVPTTQVDEPITVTLHVGQGSFNVYHLRENGTLTLVPSVSNTAAQTVTFTIRQPGVFLVRGN